MIDLRECTVLVHNVKEYRAITKIAMKQGFKWGSGDSLNRIFGCFPTRLEFTRDYHTFHGAWPGSQPHDYPKCTVLMKGVRRIIMNRMRDQTLKE